jgi:hypothetical protein
MIPGWLDTRAVVAFAEQTSAEIGELIPIGEHGHNRKKIGKRKQGLERVVMNAKAFSANNKLNFYKRAKLANTLQWKLKEAGYPPDFVRDVVEMVVFNL